jgi:hypothetical protein
MARADAAPGDEDDIDPIGDDDAEEGDFDDDDDDDDEGEEDGELNE